MNRTIQEQHSQLSTQNLEPEGNSFWVETWCGSSVFCDGEWVDHIHGYMKVLAIDKYKVGIL